MFLLSSDKFPLADGKTEKSEQSPLKKKQHPYDNWPSSRFRDVKIPIAETSTLSNRKQEKKKKRRKLPLKKKQQR
jgi:hypothetical protein